MVCPPSFGDSEVEVAAIGDTGLFADSGRELANHSSKPTDVMAPVIGLM